MPQKEIEVILARQLASHLALPIFIIDPQGTLLYYNEYAEMLLGRHFEVTGEMPASEWSTIFEPTDEQGAPIPPEALPLMVALTQRQAAHGSLWIRGLDQVKRHIDVMALPLVGQADRFLGAIAIFWEMH
jgi:PAS domain-containing protein